MYHNTKKIETRTDCDDPIEKMLSVGETADILRVVRLTVIRLIKARRIEATKVGRQWRIKPSSLDAFIVANTERSQ
jgi:excisionase family DNA binding protein